MENILARQFLLSFIATEAFSIRTETKNEQNDTNASQTDSWKLTVDQRTRTIKITYEAPQVQINRLHSFGSIWLNVLLLALTAAHSVEHQL